MNLRPYVGGDFEALYAIEEACFAPLLRFPRDYMQSLLRRRQSAAWIAEDEAGRMAGFGVLGWKREKERVLAYLETLEVLPQARGRGLAHALLQRLSASAAEAGAELLWLHVDETNSAAIALYERCGFQREGREPAFYPDGAAALVYAKRLPDEEREP